MSWVAVMVGVGVGATAGGVSAGLNGGDAGDILKGMAIGGAMGGAGGGIGGAVFGGAGGAAAGGAGGAASGAGAGATTGGLSGATTGSLSGGATGATAGGGLSAASNSAALAALTPAFESGTAGGGISGLSGGTAGGGLSAASNNAALAAMTPTFESGAAGTAGGAVSGNTPTVVTQGLGANTPVAQGEVTSGMPGQITAEAPTNSNVLYNAPGKEAGVATVHTAPESTAGWGQQLLNKAGIESQLGSKIGGQALENAVYGAGINGLMAGAQGQDVGKAMGIGALSGGVGGAAAGGLGQMGGAVGEFATAHPMITSGAIGMGTNMALNGLTMPSSTSEEGPTLKSPFRYNPASYRAYLPHGNSFGSYAAGGITDLDNYDAAPNQPTAADPGTLNIPNRGEVANNEGYTTDAVRMMAGGGLSGSPLLDMGIASALPQGALSFLPESGIDRSAYNMTAGRFLSPDLADHLFKSQGDVDRDEKDAKDKEARVKAAIYKQKIMQQMAQQNRQPQMMAHGGISDLGSYSDGGRLLKGPGNGTSDSIPATIGGKQPARLAEGEFVVPARIVSELGNGSTDAGAKQLYAMMDRIQADRRKTTGKGKFSDDPKAYKHLPA